jgi:hypothetical protein
MSDRVDSNDIETLVGHPRHQTQHWARAVSRSQTVYLLHSYECFEEFYDLRECPYSLALDNGIPIDVWVEDEPVRVEIDQNDLVPVT